MELWVKKDKTIDDIIKKTFPKYKGRTVRISTDIPKDLDSYWVEGSRDEFAFYDPFKDIVYNVASNHPFYESENPRHLGGRLPNGLLLVEHTIFQGSDIGITIYMNQEDMIPLLPPPKEYNLTKQQKITLLYTKGIIPSERFETARRDTGISKEEWNEAKVGLIEMGLLNKQGAVTIEGRNYVNREFQHLENLGYAAREYFAKL